MKSDNRSRKDVLDDLMGFLLREFSGESVKNLVTNLTTYHRIQLSPGYREALQFCHRVLSQYGLNPDILSYPANGKEYWGWEMIEGWNPTSGRLEIVDPLDKREILADFSAIPISLVARSPSADLSGVETVVMDAAADLSKWSEISPKGKLVLSNHSNLEILTDCAIEFGAVGIITDRMLETPPVRYTEDLPHARLYSSFWWSKNETKRIPGFVLSPNRGRLLRNQLQEAEKNGESLRFGAHVDAEFTNEPVEVLSCQITGSEYPDQEIIVIAHLCHPSPGANDNASGAALAVSLATFLQKQIAVGNLTPPKRTVRFLLVPEMTGTVPFLAQHQDQLPRFIAGVNLDMVGQNQALCHSPLLIEGVPRALPNSVNTLIQRISQRLPQEGKSFAGIKYPLHSMLSMPFSGGSDHIMLSDPMIGIPTPMLIHWPDLFYHTTEDTPDKVDPKELERVGALAATYVLFLADLDQKGAVWISNTLLGQMEKELNEIVDDFLAKSMLSKKAEVSLESLQATEDEIADFVEYYYAAVRKLYQDFRLPFNKEEYNALRDTMERIGRERRNRIARSLRVVQMPPKESEEISDSSKAPGELSDEVLRRLYPVPVSLRPHIARLDFEERTQLRKEFEKYPHLSTGLVVAQYWINGERTVSEVLSRTVREVTEDKSGLKWGINLLKRFGLLVPIE